MTVPHSELSPEMLKQQIKSWAEELGFLACGITDAHALNPDIQSHTQQWLEKGYHGSMAYMENHFEKRMNPSLLVEGAESVICLAFNYFPDNHSIERQTGAALKVAKYAWGEDYHHVIKEKTTQLMQKIQILVPHFQGRAFTDSAPLMERQLAQKAGIGWIGKNSLLLRKGTGSFFFLAEILSNLPLPPDKPYPTNHCGTCTACIDACPTQAIIAPEIINANRCISYQTIETKSVSALSPENHQNWLYGCDICQDVCPWNSFSTPHQEPLFQPKEWVFMNAQQWQNSIANPLELKPQLKKSAAERAGHKKIAQQADILLQNR